MNIGETFLVNVTEADILNGIRKHSFSCPIATAMRRAGFALPSVGSYIVSTGWNVGSLQEFLLSPEAREFISDFDAGQSVIPQSFVITRTK